MVVGGLGAQLMNAGGVDRASAPSRERQPLAGQLAQPRTESSGVSSRSIDNLKSKDQDFASKLRRQSGSENQSSRRQGDTAQRDQQRFQKESASPQALQQVSRPNQRPLHSSNSATTAVQEDASMMSSLRRENLSQSNIESVAVSPEFEAAVEEVVSKISELSEDETELRAEAMREFMIVMNREFGVEPAKMVKAYTQLSPSDLAASPDQTAKQVIQNLGLEPAQVPRAERLYREMLVKTGESMLQEKLAGAAGIVALDVISRRELASQRLDSSISELNAAFTQPQRPSSELMPQAVVAKDAANQQYLDRLMMGMAAGGAIGGAFGAGAQAGDAAANLQGANLQAASLGGPGNEAVVTKPVVSSDLMTEMLKLRTQGGEVDQSIAPRAGASSNAGSDPNMSLGQASVLTAGLSLAGLAGAGSTSNETGSGLSQDDSTDLESEALVDASSRDLSGVEFSDTLQVKSVPTEKVAVAGAAPGAMLGMNTSEQRSNGPELMRQAQLLVNQGGGEMKMQLRPEGLGEVHLKVKVENGQVQIQMLTESDSAKKAIEGSLDELRSGLAQNKLQVDAMKIEVGTDLAKQRFEQQQQESQPDQARQMAQNFMGQFREGRQAFHQGLGENRGWREYQPNRIADAPTADAVVSAGAATRSTSASRRLDLVA